ncbi:hypothetical protein ZHAS_00013790 [Anopheles sinensis]|uniref:Uncharacterized protein n=1 Tax=Anopheles sinensis TaxID=74873 RepID=A0A084W6G6_ANOSI|nr:hypothetical protein ZHAS_00013790 [Anopheles sinensis]
MSNSSSSISVFFILTFLLVAVCWSVSAVDQLDTKSGYGEYYSKSRDSYKKLTETVRELYDRVVYWKHKEGYGYHP